MPALYFSESCSPKGRACVFFYLGMGLGRDDVPLVSLPGQKPSGASCGGRSVALIVV